VMHAAAQLWMPTLIIWGDRDRLVPLGDVRGVTQRFPNARLEVITNCGHMPMIEEPDATIALMRDFLNGPIPSRPL
jgi:pimeloyl-ACP methyl ester carboxylesterase